MPISCIHINHHADIILIGCGPSAVTFLYQLKEKLEPSDELKVLVFGDKSSHAGGYAYTVDNKRLLLNSRHSEMGISPDAPDSFTKWLSANEYHFESEFVPRIYFKKYLEEVFSNTCDVRCTQISIEFIPKKIDDFFIRQDGQKIVLCNGQTYSSKIVVFCHGSISSKLQNKFQQNPNFINDIYLESHRLNTIPSESNILILGSNLKMVDAYLLLQNLNKKLNISVASQNGYFPSIKYSYINHQNGSAILKEAVKIFSNSSPLKLEKVIAFLDKQISNLLGKSFSSYTAIRYYESVISTSLVNQRALFSKEEKIISSIAPYLDEVLNFTWKLLDEEDRQRAKPIAKYFLRYICGLPELNFSRLRALLSDPSFYVLKISSIETSGNKFIAEFKPDQKVGTYDYMINCTGMRGFYSDENQSDLAKNIRSHRQLKLTNEGGLHICSATSRVYSPQQRLYTDIYSIGEANVGSNFICYSFPFYVGEARNAVESIFSNSFAYALS